MIIRKALIPIVFFVFLFSGCHKEKYELLQGNWQEINVADIEATHYNEWNFDNSVLTITRVLISNPAIRTVTDTGLYRLKTSVFGMELRIDNTSYELFNDDWRIIDLSRDRFYMKLDIPGGIIYREFIKIP
jgi:hypothetical protein